MKKNKTKPGLSQARYRKKLARKNKKRVVKSPVLTRAPAEVLVV